MPKKKKKIVLEFIFKESQDEYDPEYTYLNLTKMRLGKDTTLTDEERDYITEDWGQSDFWHVNIHNDILNVIDTGESVRYS